MANSFQVNIDDLDEDTVREMLEEFASDDLVTVYFEREEGDLVAGITDDVTWDQAATGLAMEVGELTDSHIARWLDWTMEISDTQSSEMDESDEGDVDDIIDEDDL
ncbi:MAG: hypothetical protein R3310_01340 [Candidatus Competibacteraceae bacterium]|nr:hypothetical protein [Candidatus Competibacteraceae bacterium]